MKCWNCLTPLGKSDYLCPSCQQTTKPNPMQAAAAKGRLEYLLHETQVWNFLSPDLKTELAHVYQNRKERLEAVFRGGNPRAWPDSDWTAPVFGPAEIQQTSSRLAPHVVTEKLERLAGHSPLEGGIDVEQTASAFEPTRVDATISTSVPTVPQPLQEAPPSGSEKTPAAGLGLSHGEALEIPSEESAAHADWSHFTPRAASAADPVEQVSETFAQQTREEALSAKILAEADIRWFHSLGALLVIAAVVGWLRATWDGYGKNLAGFLILCSPAALHGFAYQMRKSVPLSSRLLSILAGILTAPALLAVEVFDFLPPGVDGKDYWTLALLVSATLLGWQAQTTRELVPLYVGALCTVLAGWSQGALVTSVLCLLLGFVLAPVSPSPEDEPEQREWSEHLQKVGLFSGVFGSFASLFLFHTETAPGMPLVMFTGALIYLHVPNLTRRPGASTANKVTLQAAVTVLGIFLMRVALDIPPSAIGLYALLAAGLFLCARPEDEGGLLALRFGSMVGFLGLGIGFFSQNPLILQDTVTGTPEAVLRFLLAVVGAGLYGYLSRKKNLESQRDLLGLAALFSMFGGWFHLFIRFCEPVDGSLLTVNGQLAPLFASFGLLAVIWLVGSRWLERREQELVASVSLPLLFCSIGTAGASGLLAETAQSLVWARVLAWLGLVCLLWERSVLVPRATEGNQTPLAVGPALDLLLPRLVLWSFIAAVVLGEFLALKQLALPIQVLGLVLMLSPARAYRQPGLETVWLFTFVALGTLWSNDLFPLHFVALYLLFAAGWAAGSLKPLSLSLASGVGLTVLLATPHTAMSPLVFLSVPLAYALAIAAPVPGKGPWTPAEPTRYGFDMLFLAAMFLPYNVAPDSLASLGFTVSLPIIAVLLGYLSSQPVTSRVVSHYSGHALLVVGFLWSLQQGATESGLLMLLASGWAFTLKKEIVPNFSSWDLANGLALTGATWLCSTSHLIINGQVLAACLILSEILALITTRWRPDLSNGLLMMILYLATFGRELDGHYQDFADLALLAGLVMSIRGLKTATVTSVGVGTVTFLLLVDRHLQGADMALKYRLLPVALVVMAISAFLLAKPDHPTRQALGYQPMSGIRLGLALLALPPLLDFTLGNDLLVNFSWVLLVGCSTLLGSSAFPTESEMRAQLRQAAAWTLSGWALVSLGRAAMKLPWQGATMVLGMILLGVGAVVERRRQKP